MSRNPGFITYHCYIISAGITSTFLSKKSWVELEVTGELIFLNDNEYIYCYSVFFSLLSFLIAIL